MATACDISRLTCPVLVPPDQYYVRRECASSDYSDYWGTVTDPDGNERDRLSEAERLQYLEDVAEELDFVRSLGPDLLDVGCGPGWFIHEVGFGAGVEVCPAAKREASKHMFVYDGVPAGQPFHVVRCSHVIEHVGDPCEMLELMHSCVIAGGWLIISTPDFGGPAAERFGDDYRMLHDRTHCSLFTNESMHRFLRDHGFSIERVTYPFPERYRAGMSWDHSTAWPGNHMTFYARKV